MAYSHYEVDETLKPARDLMDAMLGIWFAPWLVLIQKQDDTDDFTSIAAQYGYAGADAAGKEANAQASFAEIDSSWSTVDGKIE